MAQFEINIDDREFRRGLRRMKAVFGNYKMLKPELRKAAKPWKDVANNAVYNYIQNETGQMGRSIGISTFESPRRGEVGVKARPVKSRDSKKSAGWRAHFFATPAKQIRSSKRIPFNTLYASKDAEVIANVVGSVRQIFRKLGFN